MYRSIVDRPSNDYPTAQFLDVVLPHFRHGSKATDVADRLDLIIRKTSAMFGEYAFTNLKPPRDLEPGQELRYQPIGPFTDRSTGSMRVDMEQVPGGDEHP